MVRMVDVGRKILERGGWAPLAVFTVHVLASRVLDLYEAWPQADIPMHFAGGLAMAYFVSRSFRALLREVERSNRTTVLELILVVSLTATAAVFWEFAEFVHDRALDADAQGGLANTMQDLAVGIGGALTFAGFRARGLRAGTDALREVVTDWLGSGAA